MTELSLITATKSLIDNRDSSAVAADADGDIEEVLKYIQGATGVFFEQADVPVTISVPDAATDVFDLTAANTRYIVRNLRLKAANPGVNTLTVSLQELINDGETVVDTFTIDATNWNDYHSLMDMFGVPHITGDNIRVYCTYSVAGPITVTGQYQYAKTNV